jgi:asparagine synthase (glutamine-hydrolysing)
MYAFAIWDTRRENIFLARDPFGIKPLYFYDNGSTLRFASQVKALLAGGKVETTPESAGHIGYWVFGYVPEPWTLYKNIVSLKPGTWMNININAEKNTGEFQSIKKIMESNPLESHEVDTSKNLNNSYCRDKPLRDILVDSVRHHLISDAPIGVFLSAGIDSTTLTAIASEFKSKVHTVTLGFEEYRESYADETIIAEKIAKKYGCQHSTVWIGRSEFEDILSKFISAMDQPSTDGLNTWLISRAASKLGLKVAISGIGGDELFGGYPSFQQLPRIKKITRFFKDIPRVGVFTRDFSKLFLQSFTSAKYASLFEYGPTWSGAYLLRRATRMPWEVYSLLGKKFNGVTYTKDFISSGIKSLVGSFQSDLSFENMENSHKIVSFLEVTQYMKNQLLRDADWAGMAHSLEIRVPIVDILVLTYINQDLENGFSKIHLKGDLAKCANPPLLSEVISRPKTGFTVPVKDWIMQDNSQDKCQRGQRDWQSYVMSNFYEST